MHSVEYYNKNAEAFVVGTVKCDVSSAYANFLPHLVQGATLLDAGCGSGRDSLYFKEEGFQVTAFDAFIEYDMNQTSIVPFISPLFAPLEIWTTADLRSLAQSPDKAWLNILVKKEGTS
ncbi:MAG: hypothetical protein S4CHLAM123_04650 [Chlamydiales bacterium]|nr:hypothetical protein [Chlamydiales bacterium]